MITFLFHNIENIEVIYSVTFFNNILEEKATTPDDNTEELTVDNTAYIKFAPMTCVDVE